MSFSHLTLLCTVLSAALVAGLFYGYQVSVNKGLRALTDAEYLRAMQSINRVILNPGFFASFLGAAILLPLNVWLQSKTAGTTATWLFLGAALTYIVGVFGLTMACNVPLNNRLDAYDIGNASAAALRQMRVQFEGPWNGWHAWRTFFSIGSLVLLILGMMTRCKQGIAP